MTLIFNEFFRFNVFFRDFNGLFPFVFSFNSFRHHQSERRRMGGGVMSALWQAVRTFVCLLAEDEGEQHFRQCLHHPIGNTSTVLLRDDKGTSSQKAPWPRPSSGAVIRTRNGGFSLERIIRRIRSITDKLYNTEISRRITYHHQLCVFLLLVRAVWYFLGGVWRRSSPSTKSSQSS